ncbi:HNH endonuclease [Sanguibacter sp. A247]
MSQLEVDHIVAKSRGGNNSSFNARPLCARCNNIKGAR